MAGEGDAGPQLPPAPLAEEREPVEARLSWLVVPLLVGAAVVLWFVRKLATSYAASMQPQLPFEWGTAWSLRRLLPGLEAPVWDGLMFGLGLILADRYAPRSWSRPWKWALGAAVLGILPSPSSAWMYGRDLLDGSFWQWWPTTAYFKASNLVTDGFLGYWLARALQKRGSLWWRMPEAAVDALLICYVIEIPLFLFYSSVINPPPGGLGSLLKDIKDSATWAGIGLTLALVLVGGILKGLALATGMSRGVPLTQRTDIGEIASNVGANLKARIKWMFS